ncbi:hypothetical protein [Candidatus Uabimicrobium amorphum]|uniref:Uncharacterized protein n=1 Tax=Uabimicrobium amorphum TaxID=2596890 RepID=A0A5S9IRF6_UABAM|nr:hypothetical protein [Candidatus Uabimicrobium amorphum]BBM85315.1 hypothetical protein UABAM_03681 [Candidatus Uabimicrobium amorphum]
MKFITIVICLFSFVVAQNIDFKMEEDKRNNTTWTFRYPQKVSGTYTCRLIFNNKNEIVNSRLWLQFHQRHFSYVYTSKSRKILKGKYTLEILKSPNSDTQSIPQKYHFYIGAPPEIAKQHYNYLHLFLLLDKENEWCSTLRKERSDLIAKNPKENTIEEWYRKNIEKLNDWRQKTNKFFSPNTIVTYDLFVQQSTLSLLKTYQEIMDMHKRWLLSGGDLTKLSPQFTNILMNLEKQVTTLHQQIRTHILQFNKKDIGNLLKQIAQIESLEPIDHWKIELQIHQLILTNNQYPKVANSLQKIERVLREINDRLTQKNVQKIKTLISQTQKIIETNSFEKNNNDKIYVANLLQQVSTEKGLDQITDKQLEATEKKLLLMKEHKCHRLLTGLVYWIKVYKMYKKQNPQKEIHLKKTQLSIQLIVVELKKCIKESQ